MMFKSFLPLVTFAVAIVKASHVLHGRQSTLPSGWTAIGCYSDDVSSRTLRTASTTDVDGMTVEECIAFCTPNAYQFAGVEFGRECYCDNIIETPGGPATDGCNMACTGDANEICGGPNRINIYNNTAVSHPPPPPVAAIKQTVGIFQYKGCFQANFQGDPTLFPALSISAGVSAESCTAACQASGFPLAGLLSGNSCSCGNYVTMVIPAPDSACNVPCQSDATELCGADDFFAVYQDITATPPNPSSCINSFPLTSFTFDMLAVPTSGGASSLIGLLLVQDGPPPGTLPAFYVLTATTAGIHTYRFSGNTFRPDLGLPSRALPPILGGNQVFTRDLSLKDPYNQYCLKPNPLPGLFGPFIGPPTLSVNNHNDLWALCSNTTAGGRIDLVFSPQATAHDYNLSSCQSVVLTIQPPTDGCTFC